MSDYLEVAKECGIATGICGDSSTRKKLESYTSLILAKQQAAHDAEIARLKEEIDNLRESWKQEKLLVESRNQMFNAANEACAMKDEALKLFAGEALPNWYQADCECTKCSDYRSARKAISATSQQVSEWERKQLAEAEQRGAVKALEDAATELSDLREGAFNFKRWLRKRADKLRATSKKAG